jgi:hypothetical protein
MYIGSTCFSLTKCMSNFKRKSLSKVNWRYDDFYKLIYYNNVNIELIQNCPCNNADEVLSKKNEVRDKLINEIKKIVTYVCVCMCMYVCIYIRMHTHVHARTYVCVLTCVMYVCIYIHTRMHMYACTYVCMYACM